MKCEVVALVVNMHSEIVCQDPSQTEVVGGCEDASQGLEAARGSTFGTATPKEAIAEVNVRNYEVTKPE